MKRSSKVDKLGSVEPGREEPEDAPRAVFNAGADYSYRVRVKGSLAAKYSEQASSSSRDVEDVMEERLRSCVSHTASKPVYFDDGARFRLEAICDANIDSADKALRILEGKAAMTVNGIDLGDILTPTDIERIRSRAEAYGKTFKQYLSESIIYGVKSTTGQL